MNNKQDAEKNREVTAGLLAANMDGSIADIEKDVAARFSSADVNLLVAKLDERAKKQEV